MKTIPIAISAAALLAAPLFAQDSSNPQPPTPPAPPHPPAVHELAPPPPGGPQPPRERKLGGEANRDEEHRRGRDIRRGNDGPGGPEDRRERDHDHGDRPGPDRRVDGDRPERGERAERNERAERREQNQRGERWQRGPFGAPMKPTPYIGVMTSPVPPPLAAQLGLVEGFGLVVDEVVPDGPAKAAGLEPFDVLTKLNDQQLLDPMQLATLLRSVGKGNEATLTVLRKGEEKKLTVKIGERAMPERGADFFGGSNPFRSLENLRREMGSSPLFRRQRREAEERERGRDAERRVETKRTEDESSTSSSSSTTTINGQTTQTARIVSRDKEGEIEITVRDGKSTGTIKSASGETVFNGPLDTEEQKMAVPERFRDKVRSLSKSIASPVVR